MPRFLVLIYGDEQRWAAASAEWDAENGRQHRAFLDNAGPAVLSGGDIAASSQAMSIRGDEPGVVTPGPFVQAESGIGGFYIVQADDLEHAVELARGIPEARTPSSGVEVRQMLGPG